MEDEVIVVSGLPRSGTSLMMRMLEAGGVPTLRDSARPADVSNPHGYFELEEVRQSAMNVAWADRAPGHAVKVIHALIPHLPRQHRYAVLLLERDLAEVAASQQAMIDRGGEEELGHRSIDEWVPILRREIDDTRRWLDSRAGFRMRPVAHRRLFVDPTSVAVDVARFLARDLDVVAMTAAVDPALYRSRRS